MALDLIYKFLRIITPEEIHSLTTITSGERSFSLTQLLEESLSLKSSPVAPVAKNLVTSEPEMVSLPENDEKVLPFKKEKSLKQESKKSAAEREGLLGNSSSKGHDRTPTRAKLVMNGSSALFIDEVEEVVEESIDTTTFILEEKKRSEKCQKALKTQEVLRLYQDGAQVDMNQERVQNKDLTLVSGNGLLVNKRQS